MECGTSIAALRRTDKLLFLAEKKEAASLTRMLTEKLTALDHLPAALLRKAFNGNA